MLPKLLVKFQDRGASGQCSIHCNEVSAGSPIISLTPCRIKEFIDPRFRHSNIHVVVEVYFFTIGIDFFDFLIHTVRWTVFDPVNFALKSSVNFTTLFEYR